MKEVWSCLVFHAAQIRLVTEVQPGTKIRVRGSSRFSDGVYDRSFTPELPYQRFKLWISNSITTLCTVTKDGKVMSFQELKQSYGLNNQDHFREIKHKVHFDKDFVETPTERKGQKQEKEVGEKISEHEWFCIWRTQQSSSSSRTKQDSTQPCWM